MRDDQQRFLTLLGQVPARLNVEQTAWVLNCQQHDIPILITARLLKPLGNPQPNSVKYFAAAEILEISKDPAWLSKLTVTLSRHWQTKNRRITEQTKLRAGPESTSDTLPLRAAA
jgi:hypothetical protein